jgi:hypothetical protein
MKTITPFGYLNTDWFSGMGDWFGWGAKEQPQQLPPPQNFGPQMQGPWPGQNTQMPPPPPMSPSPANPSGTQTPLGGAEIDTLNAAPSAEVDPYAVVNEYTPPQKYSFLDAPGASDALVAFGAAMLKAPNFNVGLGDAALAVNRVAQQNRPVSATEYERAKQLALLKRIASGEKPSDNSGPAIDRSTLYKDDKGQTWFAAQGPNGEPGLYNQDTGEFTTGAVPGLRRDVYDFAGNRDRRRGGKDADLESDLTERLPAIASTAAQFDALYKLTAEDSTGIDSNFYTRVSRQLETLMPGYGFGGLDANNITEFNNRIERAALDYAAGAFKGQGQVTENERLMIRNAVGQPGTLTKDSALVVFKIMRDAEMRKLINHRNWLNNPDLRDQYGGSFSAYQSDMLLEATMMQMEGGGKPAPQPSGGSSGTTGSGIKWSIE